MSLLLTAAAALVPSAVDVASVASVGIFAVVVACGCCCCC